MAWTITARGGAGGTAQSPSGVSDTFTPTEGNCILVAIHNQTPVTAVDGWGITFVEVEEIVVGTGGLGRVQVWAGFVGASPGSDSVDFTTGSSQQYEVATVEIAGIDSSGAVAAAFPQTLEAAAYKSDTSDLTLGTFSAFGSATNGTLTIAVNAGAAEHTSEQLGFTRYQLSGLVQECLAIDFDDTEQSDPIVVVDNEFRQYAGISLEVKEESGAAAPPLLTLPTDVATGETTGTGTVTTDTGSGTAYAVVTQSATPPSVAQIQAGQDDLGAPADWAGNQTVTGAGIETFNATGLVASTGYFFHFQQNSSGGDSLVSSANGFTTSAPMTSEAFTVDWISLDPNSPFTNPIYSALVIGDVCNFGSVTTPDGLTLAMSGDGVFSFSGGALTEIQTFDFFIHDTSDGQDGSVSTFTIEPEDSSVPATLSNSVVHTVGSTTATVSVDTTGTMGTIYAWTQQGTSEPPAQTVKDNAQNFNVVTEAGEELFNVVGLLPNTTYRTYFAHEVELGVFSNVISTGDFSTLPPAGALLSNPTGVGTGETTANGTVDTDTPGDGLIYFLTNQNATATVNEVLQGPSKAVSGLTQQTVSITGLSSGESYYTHYLQEGGSGSLSDIVTTAPYAALLPVAVLSNPTQPLAPFNTLTASIDTDQGGGTLFYLVDVNPTALAAAIKAGDSKAVNAVGTQNISKVGLDTFTQYYVHYIQVTSGDSNVVNSLPVTTGDVVPVPPTSNVNDAILIVTGGPTINDGLAIWYNKQMSEALRDAEYRFLIENGATPRTINDMWYELLTPTYGAGSLNDMQLQYWLNGGVF